MRVVFLFLVSVVILSVSTDARGRRAKETPEQREACAKPITYAEEEGFQRPRAIHRSSVLGPSELERWGPLRVSTVIDCNGRLTSIEVDASLPGKVVQKIERKLKSWRFEPARLNDKPVAMGYVVTLSTGNR